jgi:hypothetical protein
VNTKNGNGTAGTTVVRRPVSAARAKRPRVERRSSKLRRRRAHVSPSSRRKSSGCDANTPGYRRSSCRLTTPCTLSACLEPVVVTTCRTSSRTRRLRPHSRLRQRRSRVGNDPTNRDLPEVLRRELAEMFANNTNIRDVLVALAADNGTPVPVVAS